MGSKHLNMAPYIYRPNLGQDNNKLVQYKLVSMITHVGPSPNCGHYTAIGEAGNGQFYQFDDSSVRPISAGQALNTASYVVFYEMTRSSWRNVSNATGKSVSPNPPNITNGLSSPTPKV